MVRVQCLLIDIRLNKSVPGLPSNCTDKNSTKHDDFAIAQKGKNLDNRIAPKLKRN
jgi:hypothetical protein